MYQKQLFMKTLSKTFFRNRTEYFPYKCVSFTNTCPYWYMTTQRSRKPSTLASLFASRHLFPLPLFSSLSLSFCPSLSASAVQCLHQDLLSCVSFSVSICIILTVCQTCRYPFFYRREIWLMDILNTYNFNYQYVGQFGIFQNTSIHFYSLSRFLLLSFSLYLFYWI